MSLRIGIEAVATKYVGTYNLKEQLKANGFKWKNTGLGSSWVKAVNSEEELDEIIKYVISLELDFDIVAINETLGEYRYIMDECFEGNEEADRLDLKSKEIKKSMRRK